MKKKYLFVCWFCVLFVISCADPCRDLNEDIKSYLDDNVVSEVEWKSLSDFILSAEDLEGRCSSLIKNGEVNEDALKLHIENIASKRRDNPGVPSIEIASVSSESTKGTKDLKPSEVNFYLENSGSMNGYVKGPSTFEEAILNLLRQVEFHYGNINLYYMNTKTYEISKSIEEFVKDLEPNEINQYGDVKTSNLNNIFKDILAKTTKDNISIFVSDCIYSPQNGETEKMLVNESENTALHFQRRLKKMGLSTFILKFLSDFNGKLFLEGKDRKKTGYVKLSGDKRPYYIWIIGTPSLIQGFIDKIEYKDIKDYQNRYLLLPKSDLPSPYFSILKKTNRIGRFDPNRNLSTKTKIAGIEDVSFNSRGEDAGKFRFSLAVDFSGLPLENSYLINTKNYAVSENFELTITDLDKKTVEQSDRSYLGTATHLMTLETSDEDAIRDITIELLKQEPSWVVESSTIEDNKERTKTFGIKYLIDGASKGYDIVYKGDSNFDKFLSFNVSLSK